MGQCPGSMAPTGIAICTIFADRKRCLPELSESGWRRRYRKADLQSLVTASGFALTSLDHRGTGLSELGWFIGRLLEERRTQPAFVPELDIIRIRYAARSLDRRVQLGPLGCLVDRRSDQDLIARSRRRCSEPKRKKPRATARGFHLLSEIEVTRPPEFRPFRHPCDPGRSSRTRTRRQQCPPESRSRRFRPDRQRP